MSVKLIFSFVFSCWFSLVSVQNTFNTPAFYSAIMHEDLEEINGELDHLKTVKNKEAYTGALLMKKSGLLTRAKEKLEIFKEGRRALEAAINKDPKNAEYRFLRLIIQENTPKIVNYNSEIKKDASYLRENYINLNSEIQKFIFNYSKKSKELKPEDFKN